MKTKQKIGLVFIFAFALGCFFAKAVLSPEHVRAQQSGQTFTCQALNVSGPTVTCSQYLVQVQSQRGYSKFTVWQVRDQPVMIDGSNGSTFVSYGAGSSVSVQAFELATGDQTFTLSATEP